MKGPFQTVPEEEGREIRNLRKIHHNRGSPGQRVTAEVLTVGSGQHAASKQGVRPTDRALGCANNLDGPGGRFSPRVCSSEPSPTDNLDFGPA